MIIKIKKRYAEWALNLFISSLALAALFLGISVNSNDVIGANITNQTVIAKVNVSNTEPNLYKVVVINPVDLNANGAATVVCNGSYSDTNGFDDIKNVTATFYDSSVAASNAQDSNSSHYTNYSCLPCTVVTGTGNRNGSCVCQFSVQYYANPASVWQCNMTINDTGGLLSSENSSFATINEVLGIGVENYLIDYGNLSVSQTSPPIVKNVTNTGNMPINVTLRGFGGGDEEIGMNLSMICEFGANITFGYQRYYPGNNTPYADMYNLTNQSRQIFNLTIPKRTVDAGFGNSTNSTYWRLQVPTGAGGMCNGTIIFGAVDSTV